MKRATVIVALLVIGGGLSGCVSARKYTALEQEHEELQFKYSSLDSFNDKVLDVCANLADRVQQCDDGIVHP